MFLANQPSIFGTPNDQYINAEINWYNTQSTNINDIYDDATKEPPQAWKYSANKHGEINSNYGLLIYNDKFYSQYWNALDELLVNLDTRRATMIYTRPSIWAEYNENKKNDFICTNSVYCPCSFACNSCNTSTGEGLRPRISIWWRIF